MQRLIMSVEQYNTRLKETEVLPVPGSDEAGNHHKAATGCPVDDSGRSFLVSSYCFILLQPSPTISNYLTKTVTLNTLTRRAEPGGIYT